MDRIVRVSIQGCRSIEALSLEFQPLTVLVGENGSGKSTILEALEILRRAATPGFWNDLHVIHRGLFGLLRAGAPALSLEVEAEGEEGRLRYTLSLSTVGMEAIVEYERLFVEEIPVFVRSPSQGIVFNVRGKEYQESVWGAPRLALTSYGERPPHPAMARMIRCLSGMEIHLPFDVGAAWAGQVTARPPLARATRLYTRADRLELVAQNLVNAWASLKNDFSEAHWSETMEIVRLGLGEGVESVNVRPDPGGGQAALWMKRRAIDAQLPAANLSDGTLAWLSFVALYRLNPDRTLLAIDEPELHLHPALLVRALSLLEDLSLHHPVLIATHSDRLLDLLADPARSVHVCALDDQDRTTLRRPEPEVLRQWMERYGGYGRIRGEGLERRVLR